MSFVDVLLSGEVVAGLLLLLLAGALELPVEQRVKAHASAPFVLQIAWDWFLRPLWRALAIVGFVLIAYPASYGVRHAPDLAALAADGALGATALLNVTFLATLVLPAIPWLRRHGGVVLALQGGLATAMVFGWYAAYIRASSVGYWPGLTPALVVMAVAVLGYQAAELIGRTLGELLDDALGTAGLARILAHACAQAMLAPAVLLYGYALGLQIAI
ncbi:MAG: hypothetical protein RLW62_21815 [Gammaproteobacteria bacterium]